METALERQPKQGEIVDDSGLSDFEKAQNEEIEAQRKDLEAAVKEVEEAEKVELAEPWITYVKYVGTGPLVLKTDRGEIKAFSGDVVGKFRYKKTDLYGEPIKNESHDPANEESDEFIMGEETIILTHDAAREIFPDIKVPERAEDIAQRAGEKRRKGKETPRTPKALARSPFQQSPKDTSKTGTPIENTQVGDPPPNSNPSSGPGIGATVPISTTTPRPKNMGVGTDTDVESVPHPSTTTPRGSTTPTTSVKTASPTIPPAEGPASWTPPGTESHVVSGAASTPAKPSPASATKPTQGSGAGNPQGESGETKTAGQKK